jgi:hypothetical protein
MSYLTEQQLKSYANKPEWFSAENTYILKESSRDAVSIFLSHSHHDKILVQGLIRYFASLGIKIYVDWQDTGMPRVTSRDTANKIKSKIKELAGFMILATTKALTSKWVPWEIGIADSIKPHENIVLIPVADASGQFPGSEYLQLYQTLEISQNRNLAVFPVLKSKGTNLSNYFKKLSFI